MTTDDENRPARRRVTLTGISSRAWEHPADRGALTALRELRGFDDVVKAFFGMWNERGFRLSFLAGSIRVDHRQYPRVYQRFTEAAATLDVAELPELYVSQAPMINGQAIGMDKPFIVITTAAVEKLDDDELRALLGHEIGPRAQRPRRLQDDHDDPDPLGGEPELAAGRRDRAAGDHRRDVRVVAQGRAVRRPGRPARRAGPGRLAAAADEAGRRRRPLPDRHGRVPRAGRRVRGRRRPARQHPQARA